MQNVQHTHTHMRGAFSCTLAMAARRPTVVGCTERGRGLQRMLSVLQGHEALVAPGKWVAGGVHTRRSARVHGSEGIGVQVRQQHAPR